MDLFDRAKSFLVHCASSPQIPVVLLLLWQLSLPPWLKWPLLALVAFDLGVHAAAYQPKVRGDTVLTQVTDFTVSSPHRSEMDTGGRS